MTGIQQVRMLCMLAVACRLIRVAVSQVSYANCDISHKTGDVSSAELLNTQIKANNKSVLVSSILSGFKFYIEERSLLSPTLASSVARDNLYSETSDVFKSMHYTKMGLSNNLKDYIFYINSYGATYSASSIAIDLSTGAHSYVSGQVITSAIDCTVIRFVTTEPPNLYAGCSDLTQQYKLVIKRYPVTLTTGVIGAVAISKTSSSTNPCNPKFMVEMMSSSILAISCSNDKQLEIFQRDAPIQHKLTFVGDASKETNLGIEGENNFLWDLFTDGTSVILAKYNYNSVDNTIKELVKVTIGNGVLGLLRLLPNTDYLLVGFDNKIVILHKGNLTALNPPSLLNLTGTINPQSISSQALVNGHEFNLSFTEKHEIFSTLSIINIQCFVACTVDNCKLCQTDASVCQTCKPDYYLYTAPATTNPVCILGSAIPAGYGPDTSGNVPKASACSIVNCGECFVDNTICQKCKSGFTLVSANGNCAAVANDTAALVTNPLKLLKNWWDTIGNLAKMQFSESLYTDIDKSLLVLTVSDQVNNKVYTVDSDKYDVTCSDKILSISLRLDAEIIKGQLRVHLKAGNLTTYPIVNIDRKKGFIDYPMIFEGISVSGSKQSITQVTKAAGSGMQSTISTGRSIGSAISALAGSTTGAGLDKLVSEFTYMQLVGGPTLYYPDTLLSYISGSSMLPVSVGNPFKSFSKKDSECVPPGNYVKNSIDCNILTNYGEDMTIMLGTLTLNIVISVLCFSLLSWTTLRNKQKQETFAFKMINIVYKTYGIKYFIAKMDGICLEVCIFAMLNLQRFKSNNLAALISIALSWMIVAYFVLYVVALIRLISVVKKTLKENAEDRQVTNYNTNTKAEKTQLKDEVQLDSNRFWWLAGPLEDFRSPNQYLYLYMPVLSIVRSMIIAFLLYELSAYPIAQAAILSFIQLVMVVSTVTASIKARRYDNIKETIDAAVQMLFLALKGATQIEMNESTRQYYLGGICAICLIVILLNNIIFMLVAIVMVIVETIKSIKSVCSKKKLDNSVKNDQINDKMDIRKPQKKTPNFNSDFSVPRNTALSKRVGGFSELVAKNTKLKASTTGFKGMTNKIGSTSKVMPQQPTEALSPAKFKREMRLKSIKLSAITAILPRRININSPTNQSSPTSRLNGMRPRLNAEL